ENDYITIAPGSVWFTKMFPGYKWNELIKLHLKKSGGINIYLIGSKDEYDLIAGIKKESNSDRVLNLAGNLSILQSAALMRDAMMNYVNDSAPLHLASAMNAAVTAIYCSTVPAFGFGPLSDNSRIVETGLI